MVSKRPTRVIGARRGGAFSRRTVALVSMLALTVPAVITTMAEPAGATTFSVPGLIADSAIGHATGITVDNSITLTATGGWTENTASCPASNCRGPNGTGSPLVGEDQNNWLIPNGSAFILAGRIGTSGPWTAVGSGPVTLNGSGALYMAMNDRLPSYDDNAGSMNVTVVSKLHLDTEYSSAGPVVAGTPLSWEGTLENTNDGTLHDVQAIISLGAPADGDPTWVNPWFEDSGECVQGEGDEYFCSIGDIPAGAEVSINAALDTAGLSGTINDSLVVSSAESGAFDAVSPVDTITLTAGSPPTVNIVPPDGFTNLDTAKTFRATAAPGATPPGLTIARVEYRIDGDFIGSVTTAPYQKVINPAAAGTELGAGPHTLTATAVDSIGQTASDDFDFTVPAAGLQVATTTPPIVGTITAGGNAAWPIQVTNTSGAVAHHVQLTVDAVATAPDDSTVALSYDLGAINGGLNLPATTQTCTPGAGSTFVCNLPDIAANSSLAAPFRIFVTTDGVPTTSTITGSAIASAANASDATTALGAVDVVSCGESCVIGVAAPGDPFASTAGNPTPGNPTKQVVTLSSGVAGGPQLPAVTVTLSSIEPEEATHPGDEKLCPTAPGATQCSGQISSVVANFGNYVNKRNPIRITIIARWGASIPAGRMLMEKDSGGDPIFLEQCVVHPQTREFNVPCVLPEIVHGTAAAQNLTTYTSILLTADDVHFARRTTSGGTVITPPAKPTGVTATAGVGKATVRWTAPTVTNGAAVTGYTVNALSGGVVKKTVAFNTAALTQTITGLAGGTTYNFNVKAKNVAGLSAASLGSNAVKVIGKPAAPTGVIATAGVGKATVKWVAPVNNGGAITGYVVTVYVAGVLQKSVTFTTTALTQPITALTAGKTYTFKVAAKNIAGVGAPSALSNAVKVT